MIRYVKGDLFDAPEDILAHGCNCRGGFGSGVAAGVAKHYPKAKHYFLDKYNDDGWKLGQVQFVPQWNYKVVANCATQDAYLPRGVCHADYDAIENAMRTVKQYAEANHYTIAMPKIGAGLACGDWDKIESILNKVFNDMEVVVYYL